MRNHINIVGSRKMITVVPKSPDKDTPGLGEPAGALLRVAAGGIRTIPSIVVSSELFGAFRRNAESGDPYFEQLLAEVFDLAKNQLYSHVDIRASFNVTPPGFPEITRIRNTPRSLKRAILSLFSAWSDEKFHAFQIVEELSGPSTYPALLIQNHVRHEFSLVSREPTTGARTTAANIGVNVDVVVKSFRPAHARFLRRVESCVGFPVKVIFTETPSLQVCRVEEDTMTVCGWLSALSSMRADGALDDVRTLLLIQPEMIAEYKGSRSTLEPDLVIASGSGLPASPGYASGKILLPTDPLPTDSLPRIFVCIEESPEDIDHVAACQGGLGARGGMTSHLAVVLRGMGKPGVVGASDLIITRHSVRVGATSIPEHAYVYVDGNTGRFAFSFEPFQTAPEYEAATDRAFLWSVLNDLHSITRNREIFASLSVTAQLHLANLIKAFGDIGMEMP